MKKILSVILTVVMIASMFASVVVVNAADKLTIKVDTVEAKPGDTVDVKIDLVNNVTVSSVCLTVSWPKGLTLTNANYDIYNPKDKSAMVNEPDEVDEDYNAVWTGVTSPFVFNWVSGKSEVKDDCTFVTLTFKVADDAAGELAVTAEAKNGLGNNDYPFDKDGNTIPFEIVNGAVKTPEAAIVDTFVAHSLDSMLASGKESKKLDTVELKKGDTMTILGWAVFTDLLKEMVYTIDGEEHACEDVYRDRNDASPQYGKHAGFGLDDNFMDLLGVDSLDLGTYAITIIARANGGFEKVIKTFTLKVVEELTPEDPGEPEFVHTVFDAGKVDNDTLVNAGGWTGGNYPITRFGYIVDGGAPVFAGVSLTELADSDPVKLPQNAGKYGVRFSAYFDLKDAGLAPGRHTVQLVAEFADDAKTVLPLGNVASVVQNSFEVTIEGDTPVEPDPAALHAKSFNTVWVDGTLTCDVGDALGFLRENPITGDVQNIGVRGWAWIDNSTIAQFGYKLDNGEPVFSDSFLEDRPDVYAQAGATQATANGFTINPVDVSALATGDHTITMLVKAADGTVVEIETAPFSVERPGQAAPELINSYYDELLYDDTQILAGSVDKKVIDPANRESLDFEKGKVSNITVRGWAQLSDNVADIKGFGYSIDGGAVVEGEFVQDRAAELAQGGVAGAQGFLVVVPVSDLEAGEHTIDAYVIAADGTQIKLVKDRSTADAQVINPIGVTFTVSDPTVTEPDVTEPETTEPTENPDNPKTSDVAVIALASVAAVALAGAFIGKKALKK